MYTFTEIPIECVAVAEFNSANEKTVFTTLPWISYVLDDNPGSKPIILRITKGDMYVGYFTGVLISKFGIRIIGSPFRGWSTCYMGFDVSNGADRIELLNELKPFLFTRYKIKYFEVSDRQIPLDATSTMNNVTLAETLELAINHTDEELLKIFKPDCRNFIRQFEKRGAKVEIAQPDQEFAQEYYEQLTEVFAKQNMKPTYRLGKVVNLLNRLSSEDMVLCLRVKAPEGNSIATSIFPGYNKKFFFWGGASYRSGQMYRPNEYMIWTAIRYWRDRGVTVFDMMGVREYKRKFGPEAVQYPIITMAEPNILIFGKKCAETLYLHSLRKQRLLNG